MKWSEVVQLIQSGDSVSTKFLKISDDFTMISRIITAFANTIGGQLIVGIDRVNLHFLGSTLTQNAINECVNQIHPRVSVKLSEVEQGGKKIHIVDVGMGTDRPYVFENTIYSLDASRPWIFKLIEEPVLELRTIDDESVVHVVKEVPLAPPKEKPVKEKIEMGPIVEETVPTELFNVSDERELNQRQEDALVFLKQHNVIQNKVYRSQFGVSHKTAHIELTNLVNRGYITQKGMGRSTHYVLNPRD